jgi:hypothetical protein
MTRIAFESQTKYCRLHAAKVNLVPLDHRVNRGCLRAAPYSAGNSLGFERLSAAKPVEGLDASPEQRPAARQRIAHL